MKVRVTKVDENENWYKVGEIYDVLEFPKDVEDKDGLHPLLKEPYKGIGVGHFEILEGAGQIDSHYNFSYRLTSKDVDNGEIKVDPYFVSNAWQLGNKDNTGVVFHLLKTLARYSDKNTKEREIVALYKSVKRLAELEGVSLEN